MNISVPHELLQSFLSWWHHQELCPMRLQIVKKKRMILCYITVSYMRRPIALQWLRLVRYARAVCISSSTERRGRTSCGRFWLPFLPSMVVIIMPPSNFIPLSSFLSYIVLPSRKASPRCDVVALVLCNWFIIFIWRYNGCIADSEVLPPWAQWGHQPSLTILNIGLMIPLWLIGLKTHRFPRLAISLSS